MKWLKHPYCVLLIKLLITGIALAIVLTTISVKDILNIFLHAKLSWLILATVLFMLSKFLSAHRLHAIFSNAEIEIPKDYNLHLYLLGMLYNFILPSGIGGDAYKIIKIEKDFGYTHKHIASVVFFDRISGLVALCNIACILIVYIYFHMYLFLLLGILILLSILFYFILSKTYIKGFFTFQTEAFSWGVQLLQSLCAYAIVLSLDMHDHRIVYVCVFLISSIVSVLPISIGGLGAREYTFMVAAGYLLIQQDKAVCIALLFYLITLLISLFGMYFIFKPITKTSYYV